MDKLLSEKNTLRFRPVSTEDLNLVYEWRNYPEIVALSASGSKVTWEEHVAWFSNLLANPDKLLLIIEDDGRPIGQVRFDKVECDALIMGIYLVPSMVGQGRGKSLIKSACAYAKTKWPNLCFIKAEIRKENIRSQRAFAKAGFKCNSIELQRETKDIELMIYEC